MKKINLTLTLIGAFLLLANFSFAQQNTEEVKKHKKIVIIKKSVDENGNEIVEKIVKEGDAANEFEMQIDVDTEDGIVIEKDIEVITLGDDQDVHFIQDMDDLPEELKEKLRLIDVNVDENDGERQIRIRIQEDGEEEPQIFEWQDNGDMPDDIKEKLEKYHIQLGEMGDHQLHWVQQDAAPSNRACLGVMIGKSVEVHNENGEETTTIEGESEAGVPFSKLWRKVLRWMLAFCKMI